MASYVTMRTERRCAPRKRPGGISYFEFEGGSGGIVLDASEKGLAFQAADAVHQVGPSRILISPHPEERIEVNGEVVWIDRSRKTGGLRFIEPSGDNRNRIREWLKQTGESRASRRNEEFPLPAWAVNEVRNFPSAAHYQDVRSPSSQPSSSKAPSPARTEVRGERANVPPAKQEQALPPFFSPDLNWDSQDSQKTRGRLGNGLATGFLVVVFVLASVALLENFGSFADFRSKVGNSLIRLGEKLNGNQGLQPQNSPRLQGVVSVPARASATGKPAPDAPLQKTPVNSALPDFSGQAGSQTPVSQIPKASTIPKASQIPKAKESAEHSWYSHAPHFVHGGSAQAASLWSRVEAGSTAAEVGLAQLYLEGEGVPRNCEQARILLSAAVKGGNHEARRELQRLPARGCR